MNNKIVTNPTKQFTSWSLLISLHVKGVLLALSFFCPTRYIFFLIFLYQYVLIMQPPHFSLPGNKQNWCSDENSGCCCWFSRCGALNGGYVWAASSVIYFLVFVQGTGCLNSSPLGCGIFFHNRVLVLGMTVSPSNGWFTINTMISTHSVITTRFPSSFVFVSMS